jgi:hypothetical protein
LENNITVAGGSSYTVVVGSANGPSGANGTGASGAVRIIWAGDSGITRAFPSTNTGDL